MTRLVGRLHRVGDGSHLGPVRAHPLEAREHPAGTEPTPTIPVMPAMLPPTVGVVAPTGMMPAMLAMRAMPAMAPTSLAAALHEPPVLVALTATSRDAALPRVVTTLPVMTRLAALATCHESLLAPTKRYRRSRYHNLTDTTTYGVNLNGRAIHPSPMPPRSSEYLESQEPPCGLDSSGKQ